MSQSAAQYVSETTVPCISHFTAEITSQMTNLPTLYPPTPPPPTHKEPGTTTTHHHPLTCYYREGCVQKDSRVIQMVSAARECDREVSSSIGQTAPHWRQNPNSTCLLGWSQCHTFPMVEVMQCWGEYRVGPPFGGCQHTPYWTVTGDTGRA